MRAALEEPVKDGLDEIPIMEHLVVDEIGYLPISPTGAMLFFHS